MSAMDDFNRFAFDRAQGKYSRAQYDQMTTDDWVALVEGYKSKVAELEGDLETAREEASACGSCDCGCSD